MKILLSLLLAFLCIGCRENVEAVIIRLKSPSQDIEYHFAFDRSQESGTASLWVKNSEGRLCHRDLPFNSQDAKDFTRLLKEVGACSYRKIAPCSPAMEESAVVRFRDGPQVKADLTQAECSSNSQYLCGARAEEIQSLVTVIHLFYGDTNHRDFECN